MSASLSADGKPATIRQAVELLDLMATAVEKGASDVHLAPGRRPALRIHGEIGLQEEFPELTSEDSERLIYSIMRDDQRLALDRDWETDISYQLRLPSGLVRFRINVHKQSRGLAAVFRIIPDRIPTPESIGLEQVAMDLTKRERGLVLVTGPTGSGKTTTLTCMLDLINQRDSLHILTIEDPIEFVHPEKKCVITQRELGTHTRSFGQALRSALREDPDVILVGEMRDLETIALALTASETGHLVFATLHTTDASQTVDRVIDVFPADQQQMVRTQLAGVLQAVVSQTLLPRVGGEGRVAAREILLVTPAVSTHIRERQTHQIYNDMTISVLTDKMCPLELSLARHVMAGAITKRTAEQVSSHPKALDDYLKGLADATPEVRQDASTRAAAPPPPASPPPPPASPAAPGGEKKRSWSLGQ